MAGRAVGMPAAFLWVTVCAACSLARPVRPGEPPVRRAAYELWLGQPWNAKQGAGKSDPLKKEHEE